jgi:hypothetical protein
MLPLTTGIQLGQFNHEYLLSFALIIFLFIPQAHVCTTKMAEHELKYAFPVACLFYVINLFSSSPFSMSFIWLIGERGQIW